MSEKVANSEQIENENADKKEKQRAEKRYRVFEVMQYERNPETGEVLWDNPVEIIENGLKHRSIQKYAYVRHDRDVYSDSDEAQNPEHVAGKLKPAHWHIELSLPSSPMPVSSIARWFRVPENMVYLPSETMGRDPFLDMVEYITHGDEKQQELGKALYNDVEIHSNFDWRAELGERSERRIKYGRNATQKEVVRIDVKNGELTLKDVERTYPQIYVDDYNTLVRMRQLYLNDNAPLPPFRINFYIEGNGGQGKDIMSSALAHAIIDPNGEQSDDDVCFYMGAEQVSFDGYLGQPCIIYSDVRAVDFIGKFGRGETLRIFGTTPSSDKHNIKYGSVKLLNCLSIVNGVETFDAFIAGLSGEYKRKSDGVVVRAEGNEQALRRFPIFIVIHEEDYDMFLNEGFMFNTSDWETYRAYLGLAGNMRQLAVDCGKNIEKRRELERGIVSPVSEQYEKAKAVLQHGQLLSDEELSEKYPANEIPDTAGHYTVERHPLDEEGTAPPNRHRYGQIHDGPVGAKLKVGIKKTDGNDF